MALIVEIKKHIFSRAVERDFKDLAAGLSYEAVAEKHKRSVDTVISHAKVIREELQAHSMLEAGMKAIARGVITVTEVGSKTLIAVFLVFSSGLITDDNMLRVARTTRVNRTKTEQV